MLDSNVPYAFSATGRFDSEAYNWLNPTLIGTVGYQIGHHFVKIDEHIS